EDDRAEVLVRGKRLRCAAHELVAVRSGAPEATTPRARPRGTGERPRERSDLAEAVAPASELNLIGARVEAALETRDGYPDHATRSSWRELRVIHGHGTGRRRDAVRNHLRRHPAVAAQRPGADNEGGNGATVVTLRER